MINLDFCEFNNRSKGQKIADSNKARAGAKAAQGRNPKFKSKGFDGNDALDSAPF